jgi:uncharacterized repeat protein (TIGR01451 family)
MKIKSLVLSTAAAVVVTTVGFAGPALADSPGVIDGGDIYRVKNVTKNTAFADTASANACEELQYKVVLHNSGFSAAQNISVNATLPSAASTSNVSKMTANYDGGVEKSVSDTATVSLTSAQSISYQSGTTQLLDKNSNVIKTLPDGVTAGGVNIGNINGSTAEFVQFKAKVNCPTTPTPPTPTTPATPAAPAQPTTLVNTGAGSVAAIFAAAMVAGITAYRVVLGRRLSRQ